MFAGGPNTIREQQVEFQALKKATGNTHTARGVSHAFLTRVPASRRPLPSPAIGAARRCRPTSRLQA